MQLKKKMNNYKIIHFDKRVSALAIQLIIKYNLIHNLLIPDAIIAATAIAYDLSLFTLNLKDFKYIPELRIYKP